jgi:glycosyltransferase involved in cell wall biosynthesis
MDGCTVASQQERQLIRDIVPGYRSLAVIPNGIDLQRYVGDFGPVESDTLIFPGAVTYKANFDAMRFFLQKVFPRIRTARPGAVLRITGRTDGVDLKRLPLGDGVILTGYLDDVRPAVAQSWGCVVPLRLGGGTRLKILEAMALGTPVVSTSKGAEGLEVTPGKDILIADEPAELADTILRLLNDRVLRTKLAIEGQQLVTQKYGWDRIARRLDRFLCEVVGDHWRRGERCA